VRSRASVRLYRVPTPDEVTRLPARANAVLVAGPGTGKTRKIEERVRALRAMGIDEREITVLTLTRETRRTLCRRVTDARASTMHAFVLGRLNELGDASGKRIADEWETEELLSRDLQLVARLRGVPVDLRKIKKFLRRLGTGFRQTQLDDATLTAQERQLREAFVHVRAFLVLRTFDELAQDCVQLLQSGYRLQYPPKAMVVDEYQDLTASELKLIELVAQQAGAGVFACGDDHQAIYGFREADPLSLNNFSIVYGAEPTYMSTSYRCPRAVVALSEAIARRMPVPPGLAGRPVLEPDPARADDGRVRVLSFGSMWMEVEWTVIAVDEIRQTTPDESVMIVAPYGIRGYVGYLNEAAQRAGKDLTFVDSRGELPFQSTPAFRLWLALLRLTADGDDHLAWRTILELARTFGPTTVRHLYETNAADLHAALRARAPVDAKVRRFVDDAAGFVAGIGEAANVDEVVVVLDRATRHWGVEMPAALWDEIQAAPLEDDPLETTPEDFPWKVVLGRCRHAAGGDVSDLARKPNEVLVYTVFQAKGQEAHHVFVCGACADAFSRSGRVEHRRSSPSVRGRDPRHEEPNNQPRPRCDRNSPPRSADRSASAPGGAARKLSRATHRDRGKLEPGAATVVMRRRGHSHALRLTSQQGCVKAH